jgi:hypothetical protein
VPLDRGDGGDPAILFVRPAEPLVISSNFVLFSNSAEFATWWLSMSSAGRAERFHRHSTLCRRRRRFGEQGDVDWRHNGVMWGRRHFDDEPVSLTGGNDE